VVRLPADLVCKKSRHCLKPWCQLIRRPRVPLAPGTSYPAREQLPEGRRREAAVEQHQDTVICGVADQPPDRLVCRLEGLAGVPFLAIWPIPLGCNFDIMDGWVSDAAPDGSLSECQSDPAERQAACGAGEGGGYSSDLTMITQRAWSCEKFNPSLDRPRSTASRIAPLSVSAAFLY
jgi:hypothetical protein